MTKRIVCYSVCDTCAFCFAVLPAISFSGTLIFLNRFGPRFFLKERLHFLAVENFLVLFYCLTSLSCTVMGVVRPQNCTSHCGDVQHDTSIHI